jgi:hypothetical protein
VPDGGDLCKDRDGAGRTKKGGSRSYRPCCVVHFPRHSGAARKAEPGIHFTAEHTA